MLDSDDFLRLVQVRDWLGGQAWGDVDQHRLNPPTGGDMHWSRLVDVPLGLSISALSLLFGVKAAEAVTIVLIPAVTLGVAMAGTAVAARSVLGIRGGLLAAVLVATSPALLSQLSPMRIDHHGWQVAMAAACLAALLSPDRLRGGLVAGFTGAIWAQISVEGLPYQMAFAAILAAAYLFERGERTRLAAFLASLTAGSGILFLATRTRAEWFAAHCDISGMPYLAPAAVSTAILLAGLLLRRDQSLGWRALLIGGAALGGAVFFVAAGTCVTGPFAGMDPLVQEVWYRNVLEGQPIWAQPLAGIASVLWTPLIGAAGTWLAWRSSAGEERKRWLAIGLALATALLLALLVRRAEAIAHLYALPGCAALILALLPKVRALRNQVLRISLTVAVILSPSPVMAQIAVLQFQQGQLSGDGGARAQCSTPASFAAVAALPPQFLLATIDIGPALLANSRHSVLAGAYHRNQRALREAIVSLRAPPQEADELMAAKGISTVVYCSGDAEFHIHSRAAPDGLLAMLDRGEAGAWFEEVHGGSEQALRIFRRRDLRQSMTGQGREEARR
jgi:hypothetical protein